MQTQILAQADTVLTTQPAYDTNLFIPLKIMTDMVPNVRHGNAMRAVARLMEIPEFGMAASIEYPIITGKGKTEYITTYLLSKRQSFIYAADASDTIVKFLVEYWRSHDDGTGRTPYAVDCVLRESLYYQTVASAYEDAFYRLTEYGLYTEMPPLQPYNPASNTYRRQEPQYIKLNDLAEKLGVRHNNAMATVNRMINSPEKAFGDAAVTGYLYTSGTGSTRSVKTYELNKTQALMFAARVNFQALCHFVDFWLDREATYLTPIAAVEKLKADIDRWRNDVEYWKTLYTNALAITPVNDAYEPEEPNYY